MRLTIKDIARLAGTSPTAVSFVLNGKGEKRVNPATCKTILEVVEKHGYRRRSSARSLKLRRNFKVGIAVAGRLSEYPLIGAASHHDLVNYAARALHEHGYGVGIFQVEARRTAIEVVRELKNDDVDGFIFVDFPDAFLDRILLLLREHDIPTVAAGTRFDGESPHAWAAIAREASFQAGTEYLLEKGLRKIAMLDIDLSGTFSALKRRGYENAMRAHGITPLPLFSIARPSARSAYNAALELIGNVPDVEGAILADNLFAHVVQMAMNGHPCLLLGFGDESSARLCDPPLPFMQLPVMELADVCVDNIVEQIEKPGMPPPLRRLMPCELVLAGAPYLPRPNHGER